MIQDTDKLIVGISGIFFDLSRGYAHPRGRKIDVVKPFRVITDGGISTLSHIFENFPDGEIDRLLEIAGREQCVNVTEIDTGSEIDDSHATTFSRVWIRARTSSRLVW